MSPLTIYLRCTENDIEHDYDGGRVLFKPVRAGLPGGVIDGGFVLSASSDDFLAQFPTTRADKQGTFYRLTLEEVAADQLPPDPAPVDPVAQLRAENAALQAQLAALQPAPATTAP